MRWGGDLRVGWNGSGGDAITCHESVPSHHPNLATEYELRLLEFRKVGSGFMLLSGEKKEALLISMSEFILATSRGMFQPARKVVVVFPRRHEL